MEKVNPASTMFLRQVTPLEMVAVADSDEPRSTIKTTKPFFDNPLARLLLVKHDIYSYSSCAIEELVGFFQRQGFAVVDKATGSEVDFRATT
jgi:hypothetical protein